MTSSSLHALLLLSDSALPLGSFAFSNGLESHLAHHKPSKPSLTDLESFLYLSLANTASTLLPFVLTCYRNPSELPSLDNDLDASTPCTVARRASVAQGRAMVTLWERALAGTVVPSTLNASSSVVPAGDEAVSTAAKVLTSFTAALKTPVPKNARPWDSPNAHFAPLFGCVCRALSVSEEDTAYLFLLNHAKATLSAAVRAGVMGPYQSHGLLAGEALKGEIRACVEREWGTETGYVGVVVPAMDLWVGRHEVLYSRIFNS